MTFPLTHVNLVGMFNLWSINEETYNVKVYCMMLFIAGKYVSAQ